MKNESINEDSDDRDSDDVINETNNLKEIIKCLFSHVKLPVDVYLYLKYEKEMKNEIEIQSKSDEMIKTKRNSPKKYRCKECEGCRAEDCGQCNYCLDKKKFGGQNVIKQACRFRTCIKFNNQVLIIVINHYY
jgi:hypothetical protein